LFDGKFRFQNYKNFASALLRRMKLKFWFTKRCEKWAEILVRQIFGFWDVNRNGFYLLELIFWLWESRL